MKQIFALAALAFAGPAAAQTADAPFLVRESRQAFATLQQAVDAIGDDGGTIVIAPGRYRQCAVQNEGEIAYLAADPGTAIFERAACEDKAALVLGGRAARVDGLVFQNIRVADGNGAGIRLESGDLVVHESLFRDGENGILVANDHQDSIRIERSTFSGLGQCPENQGCSHSIYNSGTGALTVMRSRFERGTGGHYVKNRGGRVEIVDSSFDDTTGRATNYMIDLSNGATGSIARNVFVQGRDKENYSAFITVAPEDAESSSDGLEISGNDALIAPGVDRETAFIADWSGDALRIGDNRLGPGIARFERR